MVEINISSLSNPDPVPNLIDNRKNTISAEFKDRIPDVSKESDKNVEVSSSYGLNTAIKDDEDFQSEVNASGQDRMLLKPNKILPCPRCNSLNTKFCYFNNHNVNQPRHFCKNCQRYWTSGGSMRNVPVGAGKRKTKHSLQQPTHSTCTSSSCNVESPVSNLEGHAKRTENNDEPLGSSLVTPNCAKNDFLKVEPDKEQTMHPLQGFPGPPWPYSWGPVPWVPPMIFAAPALCAPPVPFPFMPASFWPCISSWPNEAWRTSETLGKHSRDGVSKEEEKEKLLWVPKTLRIDDPEEAAKSSIWSTLGIKRDETGKRGSLFRGFQSSDEGSGCNAINACNILHANPAASARSQTFQESA